MRLAKMLEGHEGLEEANANLMGQVTLAWDDERTTREALLERWLAAASARSPSLTVHLRNCSGHRTFTQERLARVARHERDDTGARRKADRN